MKFLFNFFSQKLTLARFCSVIFIFYGSSFVQTICSSVPDTVTNSKSLSVRVLLDEQKAGSWEFSSPRGFILRDPSSGKKIVTASTCYGYKLDCRPDAVFCDGEKLFRKNIIFEPYDSTITLAGTTYHGSFLIQKKEDSYILINILPLEEYVFSVLKTESWPGWPVEINRVFAIASRTYVLHQIERARQQGLAYDIKNTNHHQTYTGLHSCEIIREAVESTRGICVAYNKKPILAMYDCCCGGVVPSAITGVIDFKKAPYLARSYACTFCTSCKLFNWSTSYDINTFIDLLENGTGTIVTNIKDIKVSCRDKAGLAKTISVRTSKAINTYGVDKIYKLCKKIRSYCFSIIKKGPSIKIKGKGYGHHIGLCQWGARELVRRGWSYKKILAFYYPHTELINITNKY